MDVCNGTPAIDAAPYTGPGPHPALFYDVPIQVDPYQLGDVIGEPDTWYISDRSKIQLVACIAMINGPAATTCTYAVFGGEVTMDWGDYTVTLYEARTAKQVAVIHIRGADADCPTTIDLGPSLPPPPRTSNITSDQFSQALGRYID